MFIHIPKCAGTTVRRILGRFDDTGGRYSPSVREHPELGPLDFTHLPLPLVRRIAPEDFEKIRRYEAFAIVRHPQDRFVSALSQRLKMYGARELAQLDKAETDHLAAGIVEQLQVPGAVHHPEFIHFAPQSDFISCDGERLVEHIYPISQVDGLLRALSGKTGEALEEAGTDNPTLVFRSEMLRRLAIRGKAAGERVLGPAMLRPVRKLARQMLMEPIRNRRESFTFSAEILDFARSFYAADFELYAQALETPGGRGAAGG